MEKSETIAVVGAGIMGSAIPRGSCQRARR